MARPRLSLVAVLAGLAFTGSLQADTKYLPNDTEIVVSVNLRQIWNSDLVKNNKAALDTARDALEGKLSESPEAKRYLEAAGFDLLRDLDSVTFGMPATKDPKAGFVIVNGRFDAQKFHAAAEDAARNHGDALKITKAGNFKLFEITPPNGDNVYLCLVDKNHLVGASSKAALEEAMGRAAGSKRGELKKGMQELLGASGKQSFSVVATGAALAKLMEGARNLPNAEALGPVLEKITALSFGLTITKDVQFQLGLNTSDAKTAATLAQGANSLLFIGKTFVGQKAKEDAKLMPVVDVLNTMRLNTQGTNLMLTGEVTPAVIEALMKNFGGQLQQ